uniref:Clusterin associated protein 1 n=1 Tax=Plectus sambesii TaxID=2011161 RepID=A0A914WEN0_9BILA
MSYRELRNFTETLRALGYPRLISIENFRTPNFKLVAEIMAWLLKRYDPDSDIPMVLDTEQDRVIFVKTAALFLVQKARIKVNPKKLYEADGYAVQELLKVTSVLYDAIKNQATVEEADDTSNVASVKSMINAKMNDLRTCRQLAAEIPERGASLFDLLSKEVDLREHRTAALGRPLELSEVEKSIRSSVKAVEDEAKQTVNNLSNIASDESTLDAKIEKKKADLERQQKRLAQLQTVRPAYMDEYEKLEERLKYLYSLYVLKFRNLTFMEQTQGDFDRAEVERSTVSF